MEVLLIITTLICIFSSFKKKRYILYCDFDCEVKFQKYRQRQFSLHNKSLPYFKRLSAG